MLEFFAELLDWVELLLIPLVRFVAKAKVLGVLVLAVALVLVVVAVSALARKAREALRQRR